MPEPYTSEWWLEKCSAALDAQNKNLKKLRDYYQGQHNLAYSTEKFKQAFGALFDGFADNFCQPIVDAVEERLNVVGLRMGGDETQEADTDAWRIWQANNLDADSQILHRAALTMGEAYALVWSGNGSPRIWIEDPMQMVLVTASGDRRSKLAAFKRWEGEDGFLYATLYLPDRIEKYRSPTKAGMGGKASRWDKREVRGETWPLANPLKEVPVVPFVNQPWIDGKGRSELSAIIPLQDGLNKLMADMLLASEFAAFRQRWMTGVEIPVDPETNQPIEPFKSAVDRMWAVPDEKARFGEFSESDLGNYVKAIETKVQHIATISKTPPHYLLGQSGSFPSGESLKATETGLVSKVRDAQTHFGESWEATFRLVFKVLRDERAGVIDSQTLWRDPESRTESEHVDAVTKKAALGVPWRFLMEDLGYSPQDISRMEKMRAKDALLGEVLNIQEQANERLRATDARQNEPGAA